MSFLILVRHGQSTWNLEKKFTGWVDVDLTEKGIMEAKKAGFLLKNKNIKIDFYYTSLQLRANNTLKIIQQELDEMRIEGASGGGMVKAVVNGKKDLVSININPDILTEDAEMVEDLVLAAIKEASSNADSISQDKMGALTGGMKIPGLF